MALRKFGVTCGFVDFAYRSECDVVSEQKSDEFVTFLRRRPLTDHGVDLVDQFEAALMVLVVEMRDEIFARHQARQLMPVGFSEAVNQISPSAHE
jgi:hypothetical protein